MTWDETFTEDERIVLKEVKSLLNMNQKPETASVSIVVNDSNYNSVISDLGKFERLFSGLAINYRFIEKSSEANPGDWIIDPARPFDYAKYSNVQNLPSNVRKSRPFNLSENFAACFNFSDDGKSMLAYIINKSNYIEKQYNLSGRIQRLPVSSKFELSMLNIPENLNYRLYDLDSKKIILAGKTGKNSKLKVENTKADFLLVVYP
jgi:hypothetical protein